MHVHCSLAHIGASGKPHRLGPVAAFQKKTNTIIVHLSARFFKIVCGIVEFLDRATRNCRPHSMLKIADLFCYLYWTCLKLGSLEPLSHNVSIDVRYYSFACRAHPETWIGQSDGHDEYLVDIWKERFAKFS
jgi:hypothetical protein